MDRNRALQRSGNGLVRLQDILNPKKGTVEQSCTRGSPSNGVEPNSKASSICFPVGTFVAVVSDYFAFDIGEVIPNQKMFFGSDSEVNDVICVRWYNSIIDPCRMKGRPTIEDLLLAAYLPLRTEATTWVSATGAKQSMGVMGAVGIMEVLVSFQKLRPDSKIPAEVREFIQSALGVRHDLSKEK